MTFTEQLQLVYQYYRKDFTKADAFVWSTRINKEGITQQQAIDALTELMGNKFLPTPEDVIKLVKGDPTQAATDAANEAYGRFLEKLAGYNPDEPRRCQPLDPVTESVVRDLFGGWQNATETLNAKELQDGTIRAQFRNAWQATQGQAQVKPERLIANKPLAAIQAMAEQKRIG